MELCVFFQASSIVANDSEFAFFNPPRQRVLLLDPEAARTLTVSLELHTLSALGGGGVTLAVLIQFFHRGVFSLDLQLPVNGVPPRPPSPLLHQLCVHCQSPNLLVRRWSMLMAEGGEPLAREWQRGLGLQDCMVLVGGRLDIPDFEPIPITNDSMCSAVEILWSRPRPGTQPPAG